ncbi:hypothetical protein PVAND_011287 [Polypedilum vanderplanki]|uniref:Guanylate-kinase-associated protein n=1 Tax=Polypedilum vanderplanki TaxID=319348 RepID=A0A9J6CJ02_POLVA|nr:hypothetical protein PVAND_011287 [Polypedilum vanderplanki]
MDRSIDSIGSCSLDADSTDFSDTSESLNFISPSATREDFTAGIAERVRRIQTTQPLTPKLILNQPINQRTTTTTTAYFDINSGKISTVISRGNESNGCYFNGTTEKFLSTKTIELQSPTVVAHANKKPSYLNLACCVNGYSNYTNYDSVERKEINKSREVSPIRPIITMARQQRSSDNLLSVPTPVTFIKQSPITSITKRFASLDIKDTDTTDNATMTNGNGVSNRKSFIQQRVEKLYGTTKILTSTSTTTSTVTKSTTFDTKHTNGNHNHHHHHVNGVNGPGKENETEEKENEEELYMNSLPVMKHLRPEFCRQLKFLNSPTKKQRSTNVDNNNIQNKISTQEQNSIKINNNLIEKENSQSEINKTLMEEVIKHNEVLTSAEVSVEKSEKNLELINNNNNSVSSKNMQIETANTPLKEIKDGYYFLRLLFNEKTRILKLADDAEKELEILQSDPSTVPSEDVVGLILAAIGKSRLLATKKFKQFEGLCEENLKPNTDGPQTLAGDLQGFWDMMMLQVDNIDAAYKEIQECRENGWKKPQPQIPQAPKGAKLTRRPLTQAQNGKAKAVTTTHVAVKKPSTAPSNSDAAQKREEQRKKLLEMKRKQKAAMQQQNGSSENDDLLNGGKKENGIEMIL